MTSKINIISVFNGVGLERDAYLLGNLCKDYGYEVRYYDFKKHGKIENADLNIQLELVDNDIFGSAKRNIFIPNPEWFWFNKKHIEKFDLILAKTRDCKRIFTKYTPRVQFTSFTSEDRYLKDVKKERLYFHGAGQSETKGSQVVYLLWSKFKNYPNLIFSRNNHFDKYMGYYANITKCFKRLSDEDYRILQNACQFHLCTSEYEGWGHYIWEAKSCGAIVITTDAPPMNEFIADGYDGFLCKYRFTKRMNMAILYKMAIESLDNAIKKTFALSDEQIREMSKQSRQSFLANDKEFRHTFKKVLYENT